MELQSERLLLRDFEQSDIPILYRHNLHAEVRRFEKSPPVTEYQFYRIIQDIILEQSETPRTSYYFAVLRKSDSCLLGSCYIAVRDETHRQAEIGYVLGTDYWGQGYATEAARTVIAFGFQNLNIHRILCRSPCREYRLATSAGKAAYASRSLAARSQVVSGPLVG